MKQQPKNHTKVLKEETPLDSDLQMPSEEEEEETFWIDELSEEEMRRHLGGIEMLERLGLPVPPEAYELVALQDPIE